MWFCHLRECKPIRADCQGDYLCNKVVLRSLQRVYCFQHLSADNLLADLSFSRIADDRRQNPFSMPRPSNCHIFHENSTTFHDILDCVHGKLKLWIGILIEWSEFLVDFVLNSNPNTNFYAYRQYFILFLYIKTSILTYVCVKLILLLRSAGINNISTAILPRSGT